MRTCTASSPAVASPWTTPAGCVVRGRRFFLPVRVLRQVFQGKVLDHLRRAFLNGKLSFHGQLQHLAKERNFRRLLASTKRKPWVVHPKPPFGGPEVALKYLARYTHRVAISDRRLLSSDDSTVRFSYKDYAQGGQQREMTLDALEFLRRFLLHALPKGFVRIRYYGFLANLPPARAVGSGPRVTGSACY